MTHTHRDRWAFDINDDATLKIVRNIAYKIMGRNDEQSRELSTTPRHAKRVTKNTNTKSDVATPDDATPNVKRIRVRRKNHETNVTHDNTSDAKHVTPITTLPSIDDAMNA